MTAGVLTEDFNPGPQVAVITSPPGPWALMYAVEDDVASYGEISFGVSCATLVRLRFNVTGGGGLYADIRVIPAVGIGVIYGRGFNSDEVTDFDIVLAGDCGDVITVTASSNGGEPFTGTISATLEVVLVA